MTVYGPGTFVVDDMPTFDMTIGKTTRKRLDPIKLIDMIEGYKLMGVTLAVIEAVGGRPKQSASNAFVFGYSVGLVYMALIQARIPVETAQPGVWKKAMRLPGKKMKGQTDKAVEDMIVARAQELFPDARGEFFGPKGGRRIDRMESSCLAMFGHRHMLNTVRPDAEWRIVYQKANADLGA